jgi:hypothetical protein
VDQCKIFKVDLFDSFLNPEERVVEKVRMRVAKYLRNFVCGGDMTFRSLICPRGRFRY